MLKVGDVVSVTRQITEDQIEITKGKVVEVCSCWDNENVWFTIAGDYISDSDCVECLQYHTKEVEKIEVILK